MFSSPEELRHYLAETDQVECGVYYSPITNKIKLAFYDGGHSLDFINKRGNVWCKYRRLTKSYIRIGSLTKRK